jgi:two-component system sensor histidine kinase SenX3
MRYQFQPIDAGAFLRNIVEEFRREAERRGGRVELHIESSEAMIRADVEALGCAVWNLLDNGLKYSPDSPLVWVDLAHDDRGIAIRVRDRGVGIPSSDRRRVFQKFVRGDIARTLGVPGSGIGLAVARQIVVRHGGDISVDSAPDRGTTFSIVLPLAGTAEALPLATASSLDAERTG